jgi:hypothetical protein
MNFSQKKVQFSQKEWHFRGGTQKIQVARKNIHFESFCTITISNSILYNFTTYHLKCLEKNYNFVIASTSIKIYIKKLQSHKMEHLL